MVPVSGRGAVRLVWSDGQHASCNKLLLLKDLPLSGHLLFPVTGEANGKEQVLAHQHPLLAGTTREQTNKEELCLSRKL